MKVIADIQMGVLSLWLAASLLSGHPDSLDLSTPFHKYNDVCGWVLRGEVAKRGGGDAPASTRRLASIWSPSRSQQTSSYLWKGVLSIKRYARFLQPGEVVRLTVESPKPLLSLEARVFGRTFSGHPSSSPLVWNVLVGLDLDTSPGSQDVVLAGTLESGEDFSQNYRLVIEDKVFPTRRLTVDTKYVKPPAEVLKRIREESQRTRRIFAAITSSRLWVAPFTAPVPGPANSSFGKRSILNGQPRSPHSGTDFSGPTGTPVEAPNSGRVVLVGDLYYSGNTVIVDHGLGLYSYFAHLSRTLVTEGQILEQGDVLGEIGATGRVTGPHLHWAVRLNRTRVDPLSLIAVSGGE